MPAKTNSPNFWQRLFQWIFRQKAMKVGFSESYDHALFSVLFPFLGGFWCLFYAILYPFAGSASSRFWILLGGIMVWTTFLIYRITRSRIITANWFVISGVVTLFPLPFFTGGSQSFSLMWVTMIPLCATIFAGVRSGLIWFVITFSFQIGLFILEQQGIRFRQEFLPERIPFAYMIHVSGLTLFILTLALMYEKFRNQYLKNIKAAKDELETEIVLRRLAEKELDHRARELAESNQNLKKEMEERKRLENQLLHSQKMSAVGELAGGIAHDFNNILQVIEGYTERLLKSPSTSNSQRPPLLEIKNSADRAVKLTGQLLAFSQNQIMAPQDVNLNQVIAQVEKMLARVIGEKIEIQVRLDPKIELIKTDPSQVQQMILELILNARDAMPLGGKIKLITENRYLKSKDWNAEAQMAEGDYVLLSVQDTGLGMSPSVQSRIFEPFFTTKGREHSSGLGLATIYGIMKQNRGHITVQSEIGKGSTFTLYFPRFLKNP